MPSQLDWSSTGYWVMRCRLTAIATASTNPTDRTTVNSLPVISSPVTLNFSWRK